MSIENQWVATEECLQRDGGSLGDLLARLGTRVSPALVGEREWERLLERARELPITMAAFPFGLELPLHEVRPAADFGVSVIGGSRTASFFEKMGRPEDAGSSAAGIAWLLAETEPECSPLRRIAGRKMLLEYDVGMAISGERPAPGLFLYPDKGALAGDGKRLQDIEVVLNAVASATGLNLDADERRQVKELYLAMKPDTYIRAVGAFPSREGGVRLTVSGVRTTRDLMEFLERATWSGQHSTVESTVSHLEKLGAFAHLGVHFDMCPGGVGPALGVSFYAGQGQWSKDIRPWTVLINGIREQGLAVPEKLSALTGSSSGVETLIDRSGVFLLVRGIHHIKLTLTASRVEQVKAYVFFLMLTGQSS